MSTAPRLRIAPSPTGMFHVGTARAALFNWLEARRTGGSFLLRIEDTDTARNQAEATDGILRSLQWLGLDWDEEPVFQSANREHHVAAAMSLFERGLAYWADPMPLTDDGKPMAYDGRDRDAEKPAGEARALRFRTPKGGAETVIDLVRGAPTFSHDVIEDFALLKASGDPLFLLANVIDDMNMRISHVVRGEDHLSNTPKYQLIWKAIAPDVPLPVFAHLPLLVNEKRQKLSKRRDKVSMEQFRDEGYLAEVMTNYLCLLGWSPKDGVERFRIADIVDQFSLADVQSSSAFFDLKKLDAFNGEAIRELDPGSFVDRSGPWLRDEVATKPVPWAAGAFDLELFTAVASLVQTRVVRLDAVAPMVDFIFLKAPVVDDEAWARAVKATAGVTADLLRAVRDAWADEALAWRGTDAQDDPNGLAPMKNAVFDAGEALGLTGGGGRKKSQAPVRVAITGREVGPPLFEACELVGRAECVARIGAALARLG